MGFPFGPKAESGKEMKADKKKGIAEDSKKDVAEDRKMGFKEKTFGGGFKTKADRNPFARSM